MKQEWSGNWNSSVQPRKQRKYRYNAPLHVRHKLVSANLTPVLRRDLGRRSLPLRKGDEVEVTRGTMKGFKGIIERVDLKILKVYIENANIKKIDGTEVAKAFDPSNIRITDPNMDDKMRVRAIERKVKIEKKSEPKKEATQDKKEEKKTENKKTTDKKETKKAEPKKKPVKKAK